MDSFTLSLSIALGIALQVAIYLGIGFWRHWLEYRRLSIRAAEFGDRAAEEGMAIAESATPPAWSGWRTFRVARKVVEDAAGSVASFCLEPQDGKTLPPFLPGQYLTFRLEVPAPAGGVEAITRCYSLSERRTKPKTRAARARHDRARVPNPENRARFSANQLKCVVIPLDAIVSGIETNAELATASKVPAITATICLKNMVSRSFMAMFLSFVG